MVQPNRGLQRSSGIIRQFSAFAIALSLGSCTSKPPETSPASSQKQLQIVTTFIPMTDFTKAVAGDRATVTQLYWNTPSYGLMRFGAQQSYSVGNYSRSTGAPRSVPATRSSSKRFRILPHSALGHGRFFAVPRSNWKSLILSSPTRA